jgi:hypothetical protein
MSQRFKLPLIISGTVFLTPACGAAPSTVEGVDAAHRAPATTAGSNVTNEQLPINRRFRNLDAYLAYLEKMQGPVDGPWYREIRPGVYELQTGNFRPLGSEAPERIFTRAELEKRFGFSR